MPYHKVLAFGLGEAGEFHVKDNTHWAVTLQDCQYVTTAKESLSEYHLAKQDKSANYVLHLRRPDTLSLVGVTIPEDIYCLLNYAWQECERVERLLGLREFQFLYVPVVPEMTKILPIRPDRWAEIGKALFLLQKRAYAAEKHSLRVTINAGILMSEVARWRAGLGMCDLMTTWDAAVAANAPDTIADNSHSIFGTFMHMIVPRHKDAISSGMLPDYAAGGLLLRAWHGKSFLELYVASGPIMSLDARKAGLSFSNGQASCASVAASLSSWLNCHAVNARGEGHWQGDALKELVELLQLYFDCELYLTRGNA